MLSIFIVAIAIPFIIKIVRYVVLYVLLPPVSWKEYEGEWAIITGASEGIGLAFAHSCARRNINVVLVARNKRTLFEVCVDIEGRVPGVRAIPVSCSVTNADIYKSMLKKITQSLNVTLIINCLGGDAGILYRTTDHDGTLLWIDGSEAEEEMSRLLNVDHVLQTTRIFLPSMMRQRHGAIINVSSISAYGSPFVSNYASDKAKIDSWTRSVGTELLNYNVYMQSIHVAEISTKSTHFPATTLFVRAPQELSEATMNTFGRGCFISTPLWSHAVQEEALLFLPEWISTRFMRLYMNYKLRKLYGFKH